MQSTGSGASVLQWLWLQALEHRLISYGARAQLLHSMQDLFGMQDQESNPVSFIGRWMLYQWATREASHNYVSHQGHSFVSEAEMEWGTGKEGLWVLEGEGHTSLEEAQLQMHA